MGTGRIVVGRDTRASGEMVRQAVIAGLLSAGNRIVDVGVCPTPTVQLGVRHRRRARRNRDHRQPQSGRVERAEVHRARCALPRTAHAAASCSTSITRANTAASRGSGMRTNREPARRAGPAPAGGRGRPWRAAHGRRPPAASRARLVQRRRVARDAEAHRGARRGGGDDLHDPGRIVSSCAPSRRPRTSRRSAIS